MGRHRDVAETTAENLLARILVEAAKRKLVPPAVPTGKRIAQPGPLTLCGNRREFLKRRRLLLQQAQELEGKDRTA